MDAAKSPVARAELLLAEMSLDEKIAMTFTTHTSSKIGIQFNKTGVGAMKYMSAFNCGSNISDCIVQRNAIQKIFLENSAHGIPISFVNEGLHGGAPGGTIFPEPIGQAMSWNVSMVNAIAQAIASEADSIGVDTVFAPVVNMMTDPRFGRLQEGFGENPMITSEMGRASVEGLQGINQGPTKYRLEGKVNSLGKHFAAYGAAIGALNGGPANVNNRTLHEVFLRPWMALAKAGVRSVMPSHNTVNDIPAHGNVWLINRTLRQEFGFGYGVALSDCNDIGAILSFGIAANHSEAAAMALKAGVDWDLQCGPDSTNWGYYNYLNEALEAGLVDEATLDRTVIRVLVQKFSSNLFDAPYKNGTPSLDSPAHRSLARDAAVQSMVLLKNDKEALPVSLNGKKVALFGPLSGGDSQHDGEAQDATVGSYVLGGAHVVTVAEALLNMTSASITYEGGCDAHGPPGSGCGNLTNATALAQQSDISILVLGDGSGVCGEWGDRDSLDLAGGQLQLLEAVAGVSPKTIVVLLHGRPQTFGPGNAVLEKVDALIAAWRPGEEGGSAIVDVLTGKRSPSGKLSQSWPQYVGQIGGGSVPWLQRVRGKWIANRRGCSESEDRCYDNYVSSAFPSTPLFYFGYGLSYTTFNYTDIEVSAPPLNLKEQRFSDSDDVIMNVTVTVKNTGAVDASEIVQVYVKDPSGLGVVPYWRRLIGFAKVFVKAGSSASAIVGVRWINFAQYDTDMDMRVFPGTYTVLAGPQSNVTPLMKNITV